MKQYLIYQDEQSSRFWNLEKTNNSLTVTYGRSGADTSSFIATFENESACNDTSELLIVEKLKRGYKFANKDVSAN